MSLPLILPERGTGAVGRCKDSQHSTYLQLGSLRDTRHKSDSSNGARLQIIENTVRWLHDSCGVHRWVSSEAEGQVQQSDE